MWRVHFLSLKNYIRSAVICMFNLFQKIQKSKFKALLRTRTRLNLHLAARRKWHSLARAEKVGGMRTAVPVYDCDQNMMILSYLLQVNVRNWNVAQNHLLLTFPVALLSWAPLNLMQVSKSLWCFSYVSITYLRFYLQKVSSKLFVREVYEDPTAFGPLEGGQCKTKICTTFQAIKSG